MSAVVQIGSDGKISLVPYLSIVNAQTTKQKFTADLLMERADSFHKLAEAICWFDGIIHQRLAGFAEEDLLQTPDLLLRLKSQNAQNYVGK